MPWVKIDDDFFTHPRNIELPPLAKVLQLAALCWSAKHLTDGFIPASALPLISAQAGVRPSEARHLVSNGRWIAVDGGHQIANFLEYQRSKVEVEAERAAARERQKRSRESRRMSHRDNRSDNDHESRASNGGASRDPTRPDPSPEKVSRPVVPEEPAHQPDDDRISSKFLTAVAHRLATIEARRRETTSDPVRSITRYADRILTELRTTRADQIGTLLDAEPELGDNPDTLADRLAGIGPPSSRRPRCPDCDGTGQQPDAIVPRGDEMPKCPACSGRGWCLEVVTADA